jgi:hypothetical protein
VTGIHLPDGSYKPLSDAPPAGDPTGSPLRHKGGETKRDKPIFDEGPIAPWTTPEYPSFVRVTPLQLVRGVRFEIVAQWYGPPMPGFPPDPRPGLRTQPYVVETPELARAIAIAAVEQLRRPRVPDLRTLAKRFRR